MTYIFTSYFYLLVFVTNIFNFQTSFCDLEADEALITDICEQVQDLTFCLTIFRQFLPTHPYNPEEVTRTAISLSLQYANYNHDFIIKAKAEAKDRLTQNLYAICDTGYGLLISELQNSIQSLANKDYSGLENSLSKCPRFVSDCQNALGDMTTPQILDGSKKLADIVSMSIIAEGDDNSIDIVELLPDHPYVPEEVTRVAILQSIRNAKDNHAFILGSLAKATDKTVRDLYSICDTAYGLLVNELNVATQALPPKDFNDLENALTKCPRFVNDCQNVLGSNTTPEMLDRGRKQLNLVNMANIAEGLIQH
ncbi:hypothetical protein FXO38_25452 [Capsicum annuum]|nr:hypothetical protein FXO38_25452 [Capsicum annuum]